MKTTLILILSFFLCSFGADPDEKVISIVDHRHQPNWPEANVSNHKDKEIELYMVDPIFREEPIDTVHTKAAYHPIVYRLNKDKLEASQTHIFNSETAFEKASYFWVNDSTLKVKMYNSTNKLTESFMMTYHRNSVGLHRDIAYHE